MPRIGDTTAMMPAIAANLAITFWEGAMARGRKQEVRECAFCTEKSLSEEHFFPTWMHDLLKTDGEFNSHPLVSAEFHIADNSVISGTPTVRRRTGPAWSKTFKTVCRACNSGWMGEIEVRAKGPLTKLLDGSATHLTCEEQLHIASWVMLKGIIDEHGQRESIGIDKALRYAFKANKTPPPNWSFFIGKHSASPRLEFVTFPAEGEVQGRRYQLYDFSITIRNLFFHVVGGVGIRAEHIPNPGTKKLTLLHPNQRFSILWDRVPEMTWNECSQVALARHLKNRHSINGYPHFQTNVPPPPNIGRLWSKTPPAQ